MMRSILSRLVAGALLMGFSSFAVAEEVVAIVGDKQISLKEFNERYDEVVRNTINPPAKEIFLEDLVRYEMGVQEANKKGIEKDPIVRERMRQEIYKGLIEKELGKQISEIKVTEAEMKKFYEKNPEIRTSHILIEFKPDANEAQKSAARERAKEIYAEVQKSKRPFEELVALYTDDVLSKRTGGDVGWQTSVTLVPSYYETAMRMKNGEIKGLIETQYGFHIIKLTGKKPYAEAKKSQIRAAVFDDKRKQIFDKYFAGLKKQYSIKLNLKPITGK